MASTHTKTAVVGAGLVLCTGMVWNALAGPLDPPPGPIQPTGPVLLNEQDVSLPYFIFEPGVYRLTSDLEGVSGSAGIVVVANDVTIDLNGFTLRGVPGSTDAITCQPPFFGASEVRYSGLTVEGGSIVDWETAIDGFAVGSTVNARFEELAVRDLRVRSCGRGVQLARNILVEGCTFHDISVTGITGFGTMIIRDCVFNDIAGGVFLPNTDLAVVEDCTFARVDDQAVVLSSAAVIRNNSFEEVTGTHAALRSLVGFVGGMVIEGNTIRDSSAGAIFIDSGQDNMIYNNRIYNCGPTPIDIPAGSDAPQGATAAAAGINGNIVR